MNKLEVQVGTLQFVVAYLLRRDSDRSGTPASVMHHDLCAAVAQTIKKLELRSDLDMHALQETEAVMTDQLDKLFLIVSRIQSGSS